MASGMQHRPQVYYGDQQYGFDEDQAVDPRLCLPFNRSMPEQYLSPASLTTSHSAYTPYQSHTYRDNFPVDYYGNGANGCHDFTRTQAMSFNQARTLQAGPVQFPEIGGQAPPFQSAYHQHLDTYSLSTGSPAQSSPHMSWTESSRPGTPLNIQTPVLTSDVEENTDNRDIPYSRLIYEALYQAPGHRMPLREIYNWFEKHTTKPDQDRSTKGWQNSVRHNLSMNQAFQNDKNETVHGGNSKKANSIWMLTDHAIQHGVQSTTRFRKAGSSKKYKASKYPAAQRQKSGALGGKAASRAARLRKQEQLHRATNSAHTLMTMHTPPTTTTSPVSSGPEPWSGYSPPTPVNEQLWEPAHHSLQLQPTLYDYGPTSDPTYGVPDQILFFPDKNEYF